MEVLGDVDLISSNAASASGLQFGVACSQSVKKKNSDPAGAAGAARPTKLQ
jgi:hypothetical protein